MERVPAEDVTGSFVCLRGRENLHVRLQHRDVLFTVCMYSLVRKFTHPDSRSVRMFVATLTAVHPTRLLEPDARLE